MYRSHHLIYLLLLCLASALPVFGGVTISGGSRNVTTLYVPVTGTLTSVGTSGMWYELREGSISGQVLDYGARKAESSWAITVRHLRFGANVLTVKTINSSGATESASVTLTLLETNPPTVRPRPIPTEVWWGGLSDNSQLLDPAKPWDFVKTWQDGYFIHGAQNWGDLTNTERTQLATVLKPYNTKYMYETGGRSDPTTDWPYLHTSRTRAGYWKSVATAEANGIYMSEVTHDYHADDIVEFCRIHPDWSNGDIRAAYTGDLSAVSGNYPSPAPAIGWGPVFSLLPDRFPYAKVAQTFSPIYFDWQSYPSLSTDALVFNPLTEGNGAAILVNGQQVSFTFNMYDIHRQMMNSIQALGQTHYGFGTDCPWQATANWSNQTNRLSNRQKIRDYEDYLQGRGGKHYRICNNNSVSGSGDTYDLKYKADSLKLMYLHQNEGGRSDKYIFESWYGVANSSPYIGKPYSAAPETKPGSFSNLAMDAIKYIKGIRDIAGTPQDLDLIVTPQGSSYKIEVHNTGDFPCLPAVQALESGNSGIIASFEDATGNDVSGEFKSAEGHVFARAISSNGENDIASKLLQPGETATVGYLSFTIQSGAGGDKQLALEVFWNPQDPTGRIRDRVTLTKSATQTAAWTGGGADGSWSNAANWGGSLPPFGDTLGVIFSGPTTNLTTFMQTARIVNSLTFETSLTAPVSIRLSNTAGNISAAAARNLIFNGATPSINIPAGSSQTHTLGVVAGNVVVNADLSINHNGTGGFLINRAITGTGGLVKNGPGLLTLNPQDGGAGPNANTYSGGTTVNGGTLTLGGSLSGNLDVAGGTLAPLATPDLAGNLTVGGGGVYQVRVNGTTVGSQYDRLTVGGTVTLGGSIAVVPAAGLAVGSIFIILDHSGPGAISGTFDGLPEGGAFVSGGYTWQVSYLGGDGNDVSLTILPPGANTQPVIGDVADLSIEEDTTASAIPFIVGDSQTAAAALNVTAVSSNPALVPDASILLGGSGANRSVTLTPEPDLSGATMITLTVSDGDLTATDTFVLTVSPVNDAPVIAAVSDLSIDENSASPPIAVSLGDIDSPVSGLTLTAVSSDTTLLPNANISLGGSGANRTVVLTPAADRNGVATVTLTVSDGDLESTQTFDLTVEPVNSAPTIATVADVFTDEGTGTPAIAFTVDDVDSPVVSLVVTGTSSDASLVPAGNIVFGGSGANRTVTITPVAGQSGTATITLQVSDGLLSTQTSFTVIVLRSLFSEAGDASVKDNLDVVDQGNATTLLGTGGSNPNYVDRCTVYVFKLPDLGHSANPFQNSSFSFHYAASQGNLNDNDLYGLRDSASPDVLGSDYYGRSAMPDPSAASRLQANILNNITSIGLVETSASGNSALAAFLNNVYASGAGIGRYVFLRLNTAESKIGINRATLTMSEGAAGDPSIRPRIRFSAAPISEMDAWRIQHFGNSSNGGLAADGQDPNVDGESNLLEFATGQDPHAATLTPISASVSGANVEFTYTRSLSALSDGLVFTVEWSDTLAPGSWDDSGTSEEIPSDSGGVQVVVASVPAPPGGSRFIRLRIVKP